VAQSIVLVALWVNAGQYSYGSRPSYQVTGTTSVRGLTLLGTFVEPLHLSLKSDVAPSEVAWLQHNLCPIAARIISAAKHHYQIRTASVICIKSHMPGVWCQRLLRTNGTNCGTALVQGVVLLPHCHCDVCVCRIKRQGPWAISSSSSKWSPSSGSAPRPSEQVQHVRRTAGACRKGCSGRVR